MKIVECVPNFSEGRDKAKIDQITSEIARMAGVRVLDVDPGAATNRTVVTFAGEPDAVLEAAFLGIKKAQEVIDMRHHSGEHARQGATDVCPFVPVANVTMDECVELSKILAKRVGSELGIPVYLYEFAAQTPERRNLADIRSGEYEALKTKLESGKFRPDFGPEKWSESIAKSGATVIGARNFLIAYNINLNTTSTKIAKDIAFALRERGRIKRDASGEKVVDANGETVYVPGLFKECKATGWYIPEYFRAQITINLTNYHVTSMQQVFDAAIKEGEKYGVRVTGSEIVGLVPKRSLIECGLHYLQKQNTTAGIPEEDIIKTAIISLGLNDVAPFDADKKIIEKHFEVKPMLTGMTVTDFTNELSRNSAAPGGGSVAALAGSLSAALTSMVAALTHGKKGYEAHNNKMQEIGVEAQKIKEAMLKAIDDDTDAFNKVMACFGMPKTTDEEKAKRAAAICEANKGATLVPLSVLEATPKMLDIAKVAAENGNQNSLSDAGVAALMGRASAHGAYYNVLINLGGISDSEWVTKIRSRAEQAIKETDRIADEVNAIVTTELSKK